MADDLGGHRADLSRHGRRDYRTPNIDGIAAGGMKFTQAYANSAVCSATRTALITGRYQYRTPAGLDEPIGMRNIGLPPEHPTLPSLLKKAGYQTMLIGKWHLGNRPNYGPRKRIRPFLGLLWRRRRLLYDIRAILQETPPANSGTTIQNSTAWISDGPAGRSGGQRHLYLRPGKEAFYDQPALQCAALAVGGA